jgi:hypothetical protein
MNQWTPKIRNFRLIPDFQTTSKTKHFNFRPSFSINPPPDISHPSFYTLLPFKTPLPFPLPPTPLHPESAFWRVCVRAMRRTRLGELPQPHGGHMPPIRREVQVCVLFPYLCNNLFFLFRFLRYFLSLLLLMEISFFISLPYFLTRSI